MNNNNNNNKNILLTVLYYSIPVFSIVIICIYFISKHIQYSVTRETPFFLNNVCTGPIYTNNNTKKIPKNLFLTYHDKNKIPKRVLDRYYTFTNNEFNIYILDDNDAIQFFNQYNFSPDIIKKYNSFKKGAHKADLLRYCLLYIYGGVYLDIKTELIENLTTSFDFNTEYPLTTHVLYTLKDFVNISIYQGIMVSTPQNPIFKTLIYNVLKTPDMLIDLNYHIFVQQCRYILEYYNQNPNYLIYLYQEKCDTFLSPLRANEKKDRYGLVCYGYTDKKRLFVKIRDSNYPYE